MATESELIFSPQANHNFSRILTDLKRANLSISNRLRSIREDADFVRDVADAFGGRPLVANERCGSWYVDPQHKAGSAYFKSTDGHAGQWNFSLRRLNLHLLEVIGNNDGVVVVDSTRRGKLIPDALSKTLPIWCCVLNNVLFPESEGKLYTPPNVVSRSEHAQAEARIPNHVAALRALGIDVALLRSRVAKPLRPIWVTPESRLVPTETVFDDFHPVICCTSSRCVTGGEMSEGGYIQGAGDDTENWALGLTPPVFWQHAEILLSTPELELPGLVRGLVENAAAQSSQVTSSDDDCGVQVAPCIFVRSRLSTQPPASSPSSCVITFIPETTDPNTWIKSPSRIEVGIGKQAKIAGRNLRMALPSIRDFVQTYLETQNNNHPGNQSHITIACESGKDLSIGVALALNCQFFDDEGRRPHTDAAVVVNKALIKTRLSRIMMAFPEANPSRTTLQSVNSHLMG